MLILMFVAITMADPVIYSEFLNEVRAGEVQRVTIEGHQAAIVLKDGTTAKTVLPADYKYALSVLQDKRVEVEIKESSIMNAAPFLLLAGLWIVLMWFKSR